MAPPPAALAIIDSATNTASDHVVNSFGRPKRETVSLR
jgi:hypothetical protein